MPQSYSYIQTRKQSVSHTIPSILDQSNQSAPISSEFSQNLPIQYPNISANSQPKAFYQDSPIISQSSKLQMSFQGPIFKENSSSEPIRMNIQRGSNETQQNLEPNSDREYSSQRNLSQQNYTQPNSNCENTRFEQSQRNVQPNNQRYVQLATQFRQGTLYPQSEPIRGNIQQPNVQYEQNFSPPQYPQPQQNNGELPPPNFRGNEFPPPNPRRNKINSSFGSNFVANQPQQNFQSPPNPQINQSRPRDTFYVV